MEKFAREMKWTKVNKGEKGGGGSPVSANQKRAAKQVIFPLLMLQ